MYYIIIFILLPHTSILSYSVGLRKISPLIFGGGKKLLGLLGGNFAFTVACVSHFSSYVTTHISNLLSYFFSIQTCPSIFLIIVAHLSESVDLTVSRT